MGKAMGIVKMAERVKPALKKIFPDTWLHKAKAHLVKKEFSKVMAAGKEPFERDAYPDGINLIGLLRAQMGLGQSSRLVARQLRHSNLRFGMINFELPYVIPYIEDHSIDSKLTKDYKYNINLIHINPDEMRLMYIRENPVLWNKRYNIAFWLWELEEFPDNWMEVMPLIDEVWTPSEFITKNLRKIVNVPVKTMPYSVKVKPDRTYKRDFFGLPEDKFLFMSMFDSNSTIERKNPMAAIKAYKKAFKKECEDVGYVIKINNPRSQDIALLTKIFEGYKNIYFLTETYTKEQVDSLVSLVDVFVSLHRAEGYGLVMAEAMLLGTPCIATNWSSNTEFMNEEVACMVDYNMTTLMKDCLPYRAGARWADPDIGNAADYMVKLYEDKAYYEAKKSKALEYAQHKFDMNNVVNAMEKRVSEIYGLR